MADLTTDLTSDRTQRRRKRLERELRALHAMEGHLSTKELVGAALIIPALALLCFVVAYKLHMTSGSLLGALAGSVAFGCALWLIGRRLFVVAALIVLALLMIFFEDVPDFDFGNSNKDKAGKGKPDRREKLAHAIARREALLQKLNEAKP
jgi:hypothetical protein